jgi:hypothetical protein
MHWFLFLPNTDQGICPGCRKEKGWSHILQCEGTKYWRDKLLEKKLRRIHPEIGIRKITSNKIKAIWPKTEF